MLARLCPCCPIGGEKALILKPQTFMNDSGRSVGEAVRFYKLAPEDVIVFYDELDLAPGKLKVKTGGGHAGHNGLRSMHAHIGENYRRVRLGIGHPGRKDLVSPYVLHDFAKSDQDWLDDLLRGIGDSSTTLGTRCQRRAAARSSSSGPADLGSPRSSAGWTLVSTDRILRVDI